MSKSDEIWSAGEMLGNAESSIGTVMRTAVDDYYKGQDLDTAQAIRSAANDTEARMMITAMRQGRWQDLLLVAGVTNMMERAVAETIDDNTIDPNAKLEFGAGGGIVIVDNGRDRGASTSCTPLRVASTSIPGLFAILAARESAATAEIPAPGGGGTRSATRLSSDAGRPI
mgnify:CR=1 FL=1